LIRVWHLLLTDLVRCRDAAFGPFDASLGLIDAESGPIDFAFEPIDAAFSFVGAATVLNLLFG
jgi:hypothetical protein